MRPVWRACAVNTLPTREANAGLQANWANSCCSGNPGLRLPAGMLAVPLPWRARSKVQAPLSVTLPAPYSADSSRRCGRSLRQSGTTAVTSISTLARSSTSALTSTQVMAGKFLPITSR